MWVDKDGSEWYTAEEADAMGWKLEVSEEEYSDLVKSMTQEIREHFDKYESKLAANVKLAGSPKAGIFWYTDDYAIIKSVMNDEDSTFKDHFTVWYQLKNEGLLGAAYSDAEWDTYKRSRIEDTFDGWFVVYSGELCDEGVCKNEDFVSMVIKEFLLGPKTRWEYSSHYDRSKDMVSYTVDGAKVTD